MSNTEQYNGVKPGSICCFGELLLRYSPALEGKWIQDAAMAVYIGGAELNAATALAGWGLPVKYITALPGNYLSEEIVAELQQKRIEYQHSCQTGRTYWRLLFAAGRRP
ncbi:MAG: PfkB family carbohydrate kinase [Chitinophagaceae bacterium]